MAERLPNHENARINPRKLRDYALNLEHDSGKYKAVFFQQMGCSTKDWTQLERDIRAQHLSQNAEAGKSSPFGVKYVITAPLRGPNGKIRQVTTAWIIRPPNDFPELVTIEPAPRRKEQT